MTIILDNAHRTEQEDFSTHLKRRDRVVFKSEELSDAEVQAITDGGMDTRHDHLSAELE